MRLLSDLTKCVSWSLKQVLIIPRAINQQLNVMRNLLNINFGFINSKHLIVL
jgi:hypothetical protein